MKESTAVAVKPIDVFRREVTAMGPQFAMVLPPNVTPERFTRVIVTAIQKTPSLLDANRTSLIGACMNAAQDGLLPDGREGAIVPFKGQAQWMPMVKGILKTVRNSGELASIASEVIYAADEFKYWVDTEGAHLIHEPALFAEERGEVVGAYALAKTKDGEVYVEAMNKAAIEKVRSISRARDGGPWKDWWDEMARKTVIRRLAKRLPCSTDLDRVLERDNDLHDLDPRPDGPRPRRIDAIVGNSQGANKANETEGGAKIESELVDASDASPPPRASSSEEAAADAVDKL